MTVQPYLTATQLYNAVTPEREPIYRKAVEKAITLCYNLQDMPESETMGYLADPEWLKERMWRPGMWTAVRGRTYTTGVPAFNMLNTKPCIVAYSSSSVLHTPLLLVAFPGMKFTDVNDIMTAVQTIAKEELPVFGKILAAKGFVHASEGAIKNNLFQVMQGLLREYHQPSDQKVQIVFSGHSLGGAVASLCALLYVDRCLPSKKNVENQVIVLTIGQPKTIKIENDSTTAYNNAIGTGQYLRVITTDIHGQKDCVTGYVDNEVDRFRCAHPGTECTLPTGQTDPKTKMGLERLKLHPSRVYWSAMDRQPPATPFMLTPSVQKTPLGGADVSALENKLAVSEKKIGEMQRTIQQLLEELNMWKKQNPSPTPLQAQPANPILPIQVLPAYAGPFGAQNWNDCFGDVGTEPPLPARIHEILESPCPIWPEKKIKETHILTLIPPTVGGKPLTVESLRELITKPKEGTPKAAYRYCEPPALLKDPVSRPYWFLMTKDVLPNTRKKKYDVQLSELQRYAGYEVPRLLEATVGILTEHARKRGRIFSDNPITFTRCQEQVPDYFQIVGAAIAGGFQSNGIHVTGFNNSVEQEIIGLAAVRRFL